MPPLPPFQPLATLHLFLLLLLLVATHTATAHPAPTDDTGGCVLTTYPTDDCTGSSGGVGYRFAPVDETCRTCEPVGADQHSFRLDGDCPRGTAYIGGDARSCRDGGTISFGGAGCWHVDTGGAFVGIQPCFGGCTPWTCRV